MGSHIQILEYCPAVIDAVCVLIYGVSFYRGSVSNMLVTSCRDNISRVWVETVLPDDGLVSLHHLDPIAAQNPRFRTHRHKHRFMQRLKHMKLVIAITSRVKKIEKNNCNFAKCGHLL